MGDKYPYTDFHEMNTDWIASKVIALKESIKNINASITSILNQLVNKVNRDELGRVAFTNDYEDLDNKPDIPDVSDYYDKEEIDAMVDGFATEAEVDTKIDNALDSYYDKNEVDALLDDKADVSDLPDMSNYYDKTETDTLLDGKADVGDLPDMSNYYNKTETDGLLANKEDSLGTGNVGEVLTQISTTHKGWVEPHYLPSGGTSGQVLMKATPADYQAIWQSLAAVATSGNYEDLNNKLKIFYNDSRCTDLNIDIPTIYNNGYRVYSQIVPASAANRPYNRGDGYYVMFIWDSGHFGTQFFINQTDKDISVRRYYQDAWQDWSTFNSFQPTYNNNGWYYKPLGDGWYELWGKKESLSITFGTSFGGLWYAAAGSQTFTFPFTVDNVFGLEATIKGSGSIFGCFISNYGTTSAKVDCWSATQNTASGMAVHLHCIVHKV